MSSYSRTFAQRDGHRGVRIHGSISVIVATLGNINKPFLDFNKLFSHR